MEVKPAKAKQSTTIDSVFFTITAVSRLSVNERVHSLPILSTPLFFFYQGCVNMHSTGNQPIAMQDFQFKDLKSGFSSDL